MEWRSKGFRSYRWSLLLCKEGFERGKDSNALVEVLRALCDLRFCNPEVPHNPKTQRLPRTAAEGAEIEKNWCFGLLLFWGQKLLFNRSHNHVVRIDHFVQMDFRNF